MRGAVLYGPGDVRLVERENPKLIEPTDATSRSRPRVCASDLWSYRGMEPIDEPRPMGNEHES